MLVSLDMFLDYKEEVEQKINRDTRHNFKLFEYKRNTNSWSTDFVRFDWEKNLLNENFSYRTQRFYR